MQTDLRDGQRIPMLWEEYEQLPDTVHGEYIDGELVVSPSPTLDHQTIVRRMANVIEASLPTGTRVATEWAWKPGRDEFIPDVVVFSHSDEQIRLTATPNLIVEVLSTDRAADMIRKFAKYAAAGLEHYWVIDPEGPEIIVFHLENGTYREIARHLTACEIDIGITTVGIDPGALLA